MKTAMLALTCALGISASAQTAAPNPWEPVRFLVGEWVGQAQGESGMGTARRSKQFVLGRRFLHDRTVSTYAPQKPGSPGEVHEHWSLISYDKKRKRIVLRQFHQEGFVNQDVLDPERSTAQHLVFVSEGFENLDSRWCARETYDVLSKDAFTETFEIAPPEKEFSVYAKNEFSRIKVQ